MRKFFGSIVLVASLASFPLYLACASAQKTEFQTVSAAAASVEAARVAYYDLRNQCTTNPATTTLCPQILAAHDKLAAAYGKYQAAIKLLADANAAVLNASPANAANLQAQLTAATSGVLQVAADFVTLEASTAGGK